MAWNRILPALGPAFTRFAPSPTGELHLGHVAHLVWLRGISQAVGAKVLVRMEDHDRERCRPEFESAILTDLEWLGFDFDPASTQSLGQQPSPYRQSDNPGRYQAAYQRLFDAGLLYGCSCTRSDLPPPDSSGERRYPGTCRGKPIDADGARVVRVRLPDQKTTTDDLIHGSLEQHPAVEHGDPVIRDVNRNWSYHLGVVVDDIHDGVNLVVRGEDLITSTGRQQLLHGLLGHLTPIVTAHHPLLLDENGKKLSKRDRSATVRGMREAGRTADEVIASALKVDD